MGVYEYEKTNYEYCPATGKKAYTESSAGHILNLLKSRYRHRKAGNGKIPKRKYLCKSCGFWHLTSLENYYTDYRSKKSKYK